MRTCLFGLSMLALSSWLAAQTTVIVPGPNPGPADDTAIVQGAFDSASAGDTIAFPADQIYQITGVRLTGLANVTVSGNGSELRCTDKSANALNITACTNLTVRDLEIDYFPAPFTQGIVIAKSATTFQIRIDPGFTKLSDPTYAFDPNPAAPMPEQQMGQSYMGQCYLLDKFGIHNKYDAGGLMAIKGKAESLGGDVYELTPVNGFPAGWYHPLDLADVAIDDYFVVNPRATPGAFTGFCILLDRDITPGATVQNDTILLENLDLYAGTRGIFCLNGSANAVTCRNVRAEPRGGDNPEKSSDPLAPDRVWSMSTDVFALHDCEVGPVLEYCRVKHVGDDAFNLACGMQVAALMGSLPSWPTVVQVVGYGGQEYWRTGDVCEVIDGMDGSVKATFTVDGVGDGGSVGNAPRPPGAQLLATNTVLDPADFNRFSTQAHQDALDARMPHTSTMDKWVNLSKGNVGSVIRNCVFDGVLGYGRAPRRGSTIEGNEFRNVFRSALDFTFRVGVWPDCPMPKDVIIHHNLFVNCMWSKNWSNVNFHESDPNRGNSDSGLGVISFAAEVFAKSPPIAFYNDGHITLAPTTPINNITISENVIEGWAHFGVRLSNVKGCLLRDNVFVEHSYAGVLPNAPGVFSTIYCDDFSKDLTLGAGFGTFVQMLPNPLQDAALYIESTCGPSISWMFVSPVLNGVQLVKDRR